MRTQLIVFLSIGLAALCAVGGVALLFALRLNESAFWAGIGFVAGGFLILTFTALLLSFLVKRGLRPLNALTDRVSRIGPRALDARFEVDDLPLEIRSVAEELNEMLERIEIAFERESYLTNALTNEIDTPLAEVRSLAKEVMMWPSDVETAGSLAIHTHEVTKRMQSLVNAVRSLPRCEAGLESPKVTRVHLSEELSRIYGLFAPRFADKGIYVAWSVAKEVWIETDRSMFSVMLTNLIKNAVDHTPQGGIFECCVKREGAAVAIEFTNTNVDLTLNDLERLADPFWRKEGASSEPEGRGLGLALAERFGALLNVQVRADLPYADQFRITLTLPA